MAHNIPYASSAGEKPHACSVCGKRFSTSSSLNTHRRIHSGEKPHACAVCGKRFTASSNLYYHRMTHSKEKPHKCSLCGKSFPTPGDLRSHAYVHSGCWPFRCPVCNRGFSKHTNLRNHLFLHTGMSPFILCDYEVKLMYCSDKPHACRICGKRFALSCNLRAHLRTHQEASTVQTETIARIFDFQVTTAALAWKVPQTIAGAVLLPSCPLFLDGHRQCPLGSNEEKAEKLDVVESARANHCASD
ncbi:hypothetical protein J437_LFUL015818 [Ladona fulva]|uniref:C2H2-type domain-containing protein n=1 Tax=Ladona fulva TaxID=123851 RepID=A0A8K0P9M8_LADFU|nr:hypothetical protein J437_LFUL015818 [Ladona fulva]